MCILTACLWVCDWILFWAAMSNSVPERKKQKKSVSTSDADRMEYEPEAVAQPADVPDPGKPRIQLAQLMQPTPADPDLLYREDAALFNAYCSATTDLPQLSPAEYAQEAYNVNAHNVSDEHVAPTRSWLSFSGLSFAQLLAFTVIALLVRAVPADNISAAISQISFWIPFPWWLRELATSSFSLLCIQVALWGWARVVLAVLSLPVLGWAYDFLFAPVCYTEKQSVSVPHAQATPQTGTHSRTYPQTDRNTRTHTDRSHNSGRRCLFGGTRACSLRPTRPAGSRSLTSAMCRFA